MHARPLVAIAHGYSHHVWGSERVALDCARAYRQGCWRVVFLLPGPGPFTELVRRAGFRVRYCPTCPVRVGKMKLAAARVPGVAWTLARENPELIHATSLDPLEGLDLAARQRGTPIMVQLQTPYTVDQLERSRVRGADMVLPVSREVARQAAAVLGDDRGWPVGSLRILRPPVTAPDRRARWRGQWLRDRWEVQRDEAVLGMVGQIIPRKGVDVFLRACAELVREGLAVRPVLVGDAPAGHERYRSAMLELARVLGLEQKLIVTGAVEDVFAHHAALDVLSVPSRREGLGLVAGEAMLCGVPVVAARAGGLEELVEDGRTGLLVDPDDVQDLVRGLRALVTDRGLACNLARQGRRHVEQYFWPAPFGQRLTHLAGKLIAFEPRHESEADLVPLSGMEMSS